MSATTRKGKDKLKKQGKHSKHSASSGQPLPCLYSILPTAPPLTSALNRRAFELNQRTNTLLARVLDKGVAVTLLEDTLLSEALKSVNRDKQREVQRARGRAAPTTAGEEGGDEVTVGGGEEKKKKGRRPAPKKKASRTASHMAPLPEIEPTKVEVPANFPSSDLLHAVHRHTSTLFESNCSLLPPLTPLSPFLPPSTVAHFEALVESQFEADSTALIGGRTVGIKGRYKQLRDTWADSKGRSKLKTIGRREAWRNGEKAFEASALVAVGMFVQLLAEHETRIAPPQEAGPPSQEARVAGATSVEPEERQQSTSSKKRRTREKGKGRAVSGSPAAVDASGHDQEDASEAEERPRKRSRHLVGDEADVADMLE